MAFVLNPGDRLNPFVIRFQAYLDVRLKELREKNDSPMPDDRRNFLIGQIFELRTLFAIPESPEPEERV